MREGVDAPVCVNASGMRLWRNRLSRLSSAEDLLGRMRLGKDLDIDRQSFAGGVECEAGRCGRSAKVEIWKPLLTVDDCVLAAAGLLLEKPAMSRARSRASGPRKGEREHCWELPDAPDLARCHFAAGPLPS